MDWPAESRAPTEGRRSSTTLGRAQPAADAHHPDNSTIGPTYNDANLLEKVEVNLRGAEGEPSRTSSTQHRLRRQRPAHTNRYANGAETTYEYDAQTLRLIHFKTTPRPRATNGVRLGESSARRGNFRT